MRRNIARRLGLLCLIALLALASGVFAQDAGTRVLTPGTSVTGVLNNDNLVQVYTFEGSAGQTWSFSASNTIGVPLAVVVTDAAGDIVAQTVDTDVDGSVALEDVALAANGMYYVTVFKAAGVSSVGELTFTLTATSDAATTAEATVVPGAEATPEGTGDAAPEVTGEATEGTPFSVSQVVTTSGLQVALTWNTIDDLDLEVRDPVGGSLYWETPTVDSGGSLSANINQGCEVTTDQSPTETATWSPGGIPTGSYEVLIYFQEACAGGSPVAFTVQPTVDGVALDPIQGTLLPQQVYVASFEVNTDGSAALTGLSGIVTEDLPAAAAEILVNAQPIEIGTSVSGTITNEQPYQAFTFAANANDLVTITMDAQTGSLDTFLFLLDANGTLIRSNDDADVGVTNAAIVDALIPTAGNYTIVATRYAKRIGGTEGDYILTLNTQATSLPEEFNNLPRGLLEVRLLWNTNADLQLLVRDAAGEAVFDDVPQIRSGGQLVAAGNVNCTVTQGTPFSYIYWPTNTAPRPGSYEVEVWFQSECNDPTPVSANLYITYNGREVFTDTIQPLANERYLTSFTIQADGTALPSDGGIITGADSLNYQADIENAVPIEVGTPRNGSITFDNKFDLYVFTAEAGDVVTITMNNTSGTLDPSLYLIGPGGNQVASNDDAVPGENRNSIITDLTLPASGQYIIIATHFGALYGGTTGTYSLTLTQAN